MQEKLLSVCNLTKHYVKEKAALKDVSFEVEKGELVSIIGPSGSGKSTLLRCINRMIDATSGSVVFDGQEVTHLKRKKLRMLRRKISMVFQHYNLVRRLSTIENVLHGRLGYKTSISGMLGMYTEEEKLRALEVLAQLGIVEFAYVRTDQLSGGQQQRVGIARALLQDPLLMLCDEPIASLDPKSSRIIMGYLRSIVDKYGISCLVNLHQVDFALEYSDRIIALHSGQKVFDGAPEELTTPLIEQVYGIRTASDAPDTAKDGGQASNGASLELRLTEELEWLEQLEEQLEEQLDVPLEVQLEEQQQLVEDRNG